MITSSGRSGRPTGSDGSNRQRILDAAREQFASSGFRDTTLRSIAQAAGVDVALLAHYFGNKEELFVETMALPDHAAELLGSALLGPNRDWGERLTRGYLRLWEEPGSSAQMKLLARSANSNDAALARMQALLTGAFASTPADVPSGQEGLFLAMAHLVGVAILRYVSEIPALATMDFELLVARVAPAVQLHLVAKADEDLG